MAKIVKYYIGFSTYNMSFTSMVITQKQYNEMLKKYTKIVNENHENFTDDDLAYYIEQRTRTKDCETYTEEIIDFDDGPAGVTLGRITCKEGYCWK